MQLEKLKHFQEKTYLHKIKSRLKTQVSNRHTIVASWAIPFQERMQEG